MKAGSFLDEDLVRASPLYKFIVDMEDLTSAIVALKGTGRRWRAGEIVYAEVCCVSPALGGVWLNAMVAPLPDRIAALIEFAPAKRDPEGGFGDHLVGFEDMPFNRPQ